MTVNGKHIVFDWNGTLLDDIHALHECTNVLLESLGHKRVPLDDFRANYFIPFDQFYRKLGFDDAQVEKLMDLENSVFHDNYEPLAHKIGLRKGAEEILRHTRANGVRNYILSNHIVDPIRAQLRRLDIEQHFTEVLAYADRATQFRDMTKGERLRRYRQEHNIAPEHTIIIGDTAEEIHIAHEQGLTSVAITGGCATEERLRAENPDHLIHSLPELRPILEERGFVS
jgi:phosphoglycolate phosphatase